MPRPNDETAAAVSDTHTRDLQHLDPSDARAAASRSRSGQPAEAAEREGLLSLVRDIPNFLKLLYRLARDPRVSSADKAIVLATIGYLVMPFDLIPDWIPFLGQMDDIYLLALSLDRLLNGIEMDVLLDHWDGDAASLEGAIGMLDRAGSYLPERVRKLLRRRVD